jgi:flavin-dependent dehydrogenase
MAKTAVPAEKPLRVDIKPFGPATEDLPALGARTSSTKHLFGDQRLPVILGGGLTGLAISRQLSAAGVVHVLVCAPPGERPRLGESLNAEGSLEAQRQFPQHARFFHDKQRVALFYGDDAVSFDAIRSDATPAWQAAAGYPGDVRLMHVERIGFDQALYEEAVAHTCCLRLDDQAVAVDARPGGDRIHQVRLASGRTLPASYVFDATNHLRVVPRSLGLAQKIIGEPRRVVFAHYARDPKSLYAATPPWLRATSLLRLQAKRDGVDGLAWCIPLGQYVSVGIGVDPATTSANTELLLQWTERAYATRGIAVRDAFPARSAPVDLRYQHYDHPRCFGINWLLAGPTCCQVWFPSAAGVGSGLLAARLAPDLLRVPRRAGAIYQDYMDDVSRSHGRLDWLAHDDPAQLSPADVRSRAATMAHGNVKRLASYVGLERAPRELDFGNALLRWFETARRTASPVSTSQLPPSAQAGHLFAQAEDVDPWMDPVVQTTLPVAVLPADAPKAVAGLVDLLSGRMDSADVADILLPEVELQLDEFRLDGIPAFQAWLAWLRGSPGVQDVQLRVRELAQDGNDWQLAAAWVGTRAKAPVVSGAVDLRVALRGERIAKLAISRGGLALMTGEGALPRAAFATWMQKIAAQQAAGA